MEKAASVLIWKIMTNYHESNRNGVVECRRDCDFLGRMVMWRCVHSYLTKKHYKEFPENKSISLIILFILLVSCFHFLSRGSCCPKEIICLFICCQDEIIWCDMWMILFCKILLTDRNRPTTFVVVSWNFCCK